MGNFNFTYFFQPAKIKMADFSERFVRVKPGQMRSRSKRTFTVENSASEDTIDAEIVQTIDYEPSCLDDDRSSRTIRLNSTRNFIVYDDEEEVVRFALTSVVGPLEASEDPCAAKTCGRNSFCVVQAGQSSAKCECNPGFTPFDENNCADINECSSNRHDCSPNAECLNLEGSFTCKCLRGFLGDGVSCTKQITCQDLNCDKQRGECIEDRFGQAVCRCLEGYRGDGVTCEIIPSRLSMVGYSEPEDGLVFEFEAAEDPVIKHTYDLTNHGPSALGNVGVVVTWPLQDGEGRTVSTFLEDPHVVYSQGGGTYKDPCEMASVRRRRRQAASNEDYYAGELYYDTTEDDNLGLVVDNTELTPEEKAQIDEYTSSSYYDYSHFDSYNQVKLGGIVETCQRNS